MSALTTQNKETIKPDRVLLFWLLAFICLVPWALIQIHTSLNSNTTWLLLCAERILDGGSMLNDCYDTNPPLSILIHTPPVLLERLTGMASYDWIFILGFTLALAGSLLTQYFLNKLQWTERYQSGVLSITMFASLTILSGLSFADRDHLIAMMFIPFTLCQMCITYRVPVRKILQIFTLSLGSILILVKPHYLLLPALILLHRIYKDRSLLSLFKIDFYILTCTTFLYTIICIIFYSDYLFSIAPDVLKLYAPYGLYGMLWPDLKAFSLIIILNALAYIVLTQRKERSLLIVLSLGAANGLLAFGLQLKGFSYHLLPAQTAIVMLLTLTALGMFQNFSQPKFAKHPVINIGLVALIFALCYAKKPPNAAYPTHLQYQNNVITKTLDRYCDSDCSFFMTYENMDIVSQIAYYYPALYASRFPTFWFYPMTEMKLGDPVAAAGVTPEEMADLQAINEKYFAYVTQDIEHFQPSVLILIQSEAKPLKKNTPENKILDAFIGQYKKVNELEIDRALFYKNTKYDFPYTVKFDVYLHVDSQYLQKTSNDNKPL